MLWVLIFFEVSILMFGFRLSAGTTYYTIHYLLLAVIAYLAALFYFKGKVKRSAKEGFLAGIIMLVTSIILDAAITVPLFVKSYAFFLDKYLIAGLAETLVIAIIAGAIKPKKAKKTPARKKRK